MKSRYILFLQRLLILTCRTGTEVAVPDSKCMRRDGSLFPGLTGKEPPEVLTPLHPVKSTTKTPL